MGVDYSVGLKSVAGIGGDYDDPTDDVIEK